MKLGPVLAILLSVIAVLITVLIIVIATRAPADYRERECEKLRQIKDRADSTNADFLRYYNCVQQLNR